EQASTSHIRQQALSQPSSFGTYHFPWSYLSCQFFQNCLPKYQQLSLSRNRDSTDPLRLVILPKEIHQLPWIGHRQQGLPECCIGRSNAHTQISKCESYPFRDPRAALLQVDGAGGR